MSAYFVGAAHVTALLTYAETAARSASMPAAPRDDYDAPREPVTRESLTRAGRALLSENVRSLRYRYPSAADAADWDEAQAVADSYTYEPDHYWTTRHGRAIDAICLADCFDYQACETDDYPDSYAKRWIDWLTAIATRRLPDWGTAQRDYDGPPAGAPRVVSLMDLVR